MVTWRVIINSFSELLFLIIFWNKISREKPSRPLKVSNVHMVPHDLRNGHTIMLDAIQLCHYNRGQNCPKKGLSDPQKEKRKKDCVTISEIKGVYVYI